MHTQNSTYVNIILVYLLLFVSGGQRYGLAANQFLVIIFLFVLAAWYLFTDRKISSGYLLYMTVFVGFLFSLSLYTGGSLSLQSLIATTMKFMVAYFILVTVGTKFLETFINVIVFLAAVSLIGFLIDTMHLFDGLITKLPSVGVWGYEGVLYVFKHQYHPYRNNSIFYEPGAYQGFLNATLFMIVFAKNNLGIRRKWIYITILVAALLTTTSTTGFVIFSILFALFLIRSEMASKSQKMVSVGLIMVMVTVFAAQFHEVLIVKLDDYLNPSEARKGWSAENRSFDAQTDLKLIKKHVFGLGFDKYTEEFRLVGRTEADEGSSNGVTSLLAGYGVPFGLFLLISHFLALRKLLDDYLLAIAAYLMFILFLWGESYYKLAPISFAIIAAAFVYSGPSVKKYPQTEAGAANQG